MQIPTPYYRTLGIRKHQGCSFFWHLNTNNEFFCKSGNSFLFCCTGGESLTELEKADTSDCHYIWRGIQRTTCKQNAVKSIYVYFKEKSWQILTWMHSIKNISISRHWLISCKIIFQENDETSSTHCVLPKIPYDKGYCRSRITASAANL